MFWVRLSLFISGWCWRSSVLSSSVRWRSRVGSSSSLSCVSRTIAVWSSDWCNCRPESRSANPSLGQTRSPSHGGSSARASRCPCEFVGMINKNSLEPNIYSGCSGSNWNGTGGHFDVWSPASTDYRTSSTALWGRAGWWGLWDWFNISIKYHFAIV